MVHVPPPDQASRSTPELAARPAAQLDEVAGPGHVEDGGGRALQDADLGARLVVDREARDLLEERAALVVVEVDRRDLRQRPGEHRPEPPPLVEGARGRSRQAQAHGGRDVHERSTAGAAVALDMKFDWIRVPEQKDLVHASVVEARHSAAVQPQRPPALRTQNKPRGIAVRTGWPHFMRSLISRTVSSSTGTPPQRSARERSETSDQATGSRRTSQTNPIQVSASM